MKKFELCNLNLRKSKVATFNIAQSLKPYDILCVQEPYVRNGKIPVGNSICHPMDGARAGFLVGGKIANDIRELTEFTGKDFCAISIEPAKLWVASVYCDGKTDFPEGIERLAERAAREGVALVLNLDSNAHSTLWGSPASNKRGDDLELILLSCNLEVINVGEVPTFSNEQGHSSHIDVTLANAKAARRLSGWMVDEDIDSLSDHKLIRMQVDHDGPVPSESPAILNVRKANWDSFRSNLSGPPSLTLESTEALDEWAEALERNLKEALTVAWPLKRTGNRPAVPWWNQELSEMRKRVNKLHNKSKRDHNRTAEHRLAVEEYKEAIIKAKEDSWRNFCSDVNKGEETKALARAVKRQGVASKTLLDGAATQGEHDRMMLEAHFPGASRGNAQGPRPNVTTGGNSRLDDPLAESITIERLRRGVCLF
jgi:hypothetical protein